jgi:hypothetical protein
MNEPVMSYWVCVCGVSNLTTVLSCKHCGHRARTGPTQELPEAFAESTIDVEVRAAHGLLKKAAKALHRAGAPEGTRDVEIAGARLDRALSLLDCRSDLKGIEAPESSRGERPRNIDSGRQVCSVLGCGAFEIMPNGKCEHGGE